MGGKKFEILESKLENLGVGLTPTIQRLVGVCWIGVDSMQGTAEATSM